MIGGVDVVEKEDGILGQKCRDCKDRNYCFPQFLVGINGRKWVLNNVDLSEFLDSNGRCIPAEVLT